MSRIILASKSIGRKGLFEKYNLDFEIQVSDFDESSITNNNPVELVQKLALEKARLVAKDFPDGYVIGFDTVVLYAGEILGKPATKAEAKIVLKSLSGQKQSVVSGFAIVNNARGIVIRDFEETVLLLKTMTDDFIDEYVQTHEVTRYAGGYGVQDHDNMIEILSGSFDNVIGAPMASLLGYLGAFGLIGRM